MGVLFMLLCLTGIVYASVASIASFAIGYDPKCIYNRENAIDCFSEYVDTNKDGFVTPDEIDVVQKKYMGYTLRLMSWFWGSWTGDTSTNAVMKGCDFDKDGRISATDFIKSEVTCMPSQDALCMIKLVCDKAAKMEKEAKEPRVKHWWNKFT